MRIQCLIILEWSKFFFQSIGIIEFIIFLIFQFSKFLEVLKIFSNLQNISVILGFCNFEF